MLARQVLFVQTVLVLFPVQQAKRTVMALVLMSKPIALIVDNVVQFVSLALFVPMELAKYPVLQAKLIVMDLALISRLHADTVGLVITPVVLAKFVPIVDA